MGWESLPIAGITYISSPSSSSYSSPSNPSSPPSSSNSSSSSSSSSKERLGSSGRVYYYEAPEYGTIITTPSGERYIYTSMGWASLGGASTSSFQSALDVASKTVVTEAYRLSGEKPRELVIKETEGGAVLTTKEPIVVNHSIPGKEKADLKEQFEAKTNVKWESVPEHIRKRVEEAYAQGKEIEVKMIKPGVAESAFIPQATKQLEDVPGKIYISPEVALLSRSAPIPGVTGFVSDFLGLTKIDQQKAYELSRKEEEIAKRNPFYATALGIQKFGEEVYRGIEERVPGGAVIGAFVAGPIILGGSAVKALTPPLSSEEVQFKSAATVETITGIAEGFAIGKAIGVGVKAGGKALSHVAERAPVKKAVEFVEGKVVEPVGKAIEPIKTKIAEYIEPRFHPEVVISNKKIEGIFKEEIVDYDFVVTEKLGIRPAQPKEAELRAFYGVSEEGSPFVTTRSVKTREIEGETFEIAKSFDYRKEVLYLSDEPLDIEIYAKGTYGRKISPFKEEAELLIKMEPEGTSVSGRVGQEVFHVRRTARVEEKDIETMIFGKFEPEEPFYRFGNILIGEIGKEPKIGKKFDVLTQTEKQLEKTRAIEKTREVKSGSGSALQIEKQAYRYVVPEIPFRARQKTRFMLEEEFVRFPPVVPFEVPKTSPKLVSLVEYSSLKPSLNLGSEAKLREIISPVEIPMTVSPPITAEIAKEISFIDEYLKIRPEIKTIEVPILAEISLRDEIPPPPKPIRPAIFGELPTIPTGRARAGLPPGWMPGGGSSQGLFGELKWLRHERKFIKRLFGF